MGAYSSSRDKGLHEIRERTNAWVSLSAKEPSRKHGSLARVATPSLLLDVINYRMVRKAGNLDGSWVHLRLLKLFGVVVLV